MRHNDKIEKFAINLSLLLSVEFKINASKRYVKTNSNSIDIYINIDVDFKSYNIKFEEFCKKEKVFIYKGIIQLDRGEHKTGAIFNISYKDYNEYEFDENLIRSKKVVNKYNL